MSDNRTNEPTDEQVDAAAKSLAGISRDTPWEACEVWGDLNEWVEGYHAKARAALVAALGARQVDEAALANAIREKFEITKPWSPMHYADLAVEAVVEYLGERHEPVREARQVDEAAVERACAAYESTNAFGPERETRMRAALEAFLGERHEPKPVAPQLSESDIAGELEAEAALARGAVYGDAYVGGLLRAAEIVRNGR